MSCAFYESGGTWSAGVEFGQRVYKCYAESAVYSVQSYGMQCTGCCVSQVGKGRCMCSCISSVVSDVCENANGVFMCYVMASGYTSVLGMNGSVCSVDVCRSCTVCRG